jgi:hypothetical protein
MNPNDTTTQCDADGRRRERGLAAMGDPEFEEDAEKGLVRRRQK